jgi:hypothetical protein
MDIAWFTSHKDQLLNILASVIATASLIAAITPTPKEGTFLARLYKVIDWLALNIGKAKDTGAVTPTLTDKK